MTHLVLDAEATTDPAFGQRPEERSIEQRIAAGVLLLDKPAGPTSHQVAAWVRDPSALSAWATVAPSTPLRPACFR